MRGGRAVNRARRGGCRPRCGSDRCRLRLWVGCAIGRVRCSGHGPMGVAVSGLVFAVKSGKRSHEWGSRVSGAWLFEGAPVSLYEIVVVLCLRCARVESGRLQGMTLQSFSVRKCFSGVLMEALSRIALVR